MSTLIGKMCIPSMNSTTAKVLAIACLTTTVVVSIPALVLASEWRRKQKEVRAILAEPDVDPKEVDVDGVRTENVVKVPGAVVRVLGDTITSKHFVFILPGAACGMSIEFHRLQLALLKRGISSAVLDYPSQYKKSTKKCPHFGDFVQEASMVLSDYYQKRGGLLPGGGGKTHVMGHSFGAAVGYLAMREVMFQISKRTGGNPRSIGAFIGLDPMSHKKQQHLIETGFVNGFVVQTLLPAVVNSDFYFRTLGLGWILLMQPTSTDEFINDHKFPEGVARKIVKTNLTRSTWADNWLFFPGIRGVLESFAGVVRGKLVSWEDHLFPEGENGSQKDVHLRRSLPGVDSLIVNAGSSSFNQDIIEMGKEDHKVMFGDVRAPGGPVSRYKTLQAPQEVDHDGIVFKWCDGLSAEISKFIDV